MSNIFAGANADPIIPDPIDTLPFWDGYLTDLMQGFTGPAEQLKERVNAAAEALKKDPTDPTLMSAFVSSFQESISYMNLESNILKNMKDLVSGMISNMR
jgi:type III secretion apparatus needle protein